MMCLDGTHITSMLFIIVHFYDLQITCGLPALVTVKYMTIKTSAHYTWTSPHLHKCYFSESTISYKGKALLIKTMSIVQSSQDKINNPISMLIAIPFSIYIYIYKTCLTVLEIF